jgi:hypothetical protein
VKRGRLQPKHKKLLSRIEKVARHAALDRLRGNIPAATRAEKKLDILFQHADDERLSGAGLEREVRGQQAAGRLAAKLDRARRAAKK